MRVRLLLICATSGLLAGLGWIYVGATFARPSAWIHLVAGVLVLLNATGLFWLWSKQPAV